MNTPIYVVSGFLESGKTMLLNQLLSRSEWQSAKVGVVQFEMGETVLQGCVKSLMFSMEQTMSQPELVAEQMAGLIASERPDALWIEWNGMVAMEQLYKLLNASVLKGKCSLKGMLLVGHAEMLPNLLGRTGPALLSQVAECDCIAMRGQIDRRLKAQLKRLNPGVKLLQFDAYEAIQRQLTKEREHAGSRLSLTFLLLAGIYLLVKAVLNAIGIPADTIVNIFLGIILQAVPFLLIGVLLSSVLQILVPQRLIERYFPKSIGMGMLFAVLGGFLFPVCDCASIPVFKGLLRKGVPLPAAVTFMLVTPVINPWVIVSTYYAFSGDLFIVASRICFGIITAIFIGTTYIIWPAGDNLFRETRYEEILCSCGFYEDTTDGKLKERFWVVMRHAQATFFDVGKYLVIGTFVSAILQVINIQNTLGVYQGAGAVVVMMCLAFALSLCSSSDAIVARSFLSQFSLGAIMGFIVFGPMMDIKNVLLLSSSFSKHFIIRLLLTTFGVCFGVVYLLSKMGGM
ncbi:permease [Fusibacter paucivorans]|uniref:Permease n=1 Tax=Fusibacter paucivorans TaxID=76009 RepID=A0ABS5PJ39_9FIRM|nr:permease [Fusibacter paucivorans]MBS7525100.1 permease [Fusibacter paucivorans]